MLMNAQIEPIGYTQTATENDEINKRPRPLPLPLWCKNAIKNERKTTFKTASKEKKTKQTNDAKFFARAGPKRLKKYNVILLDCFGCSV